MYAQVMLKIVDKIKLLIQINTMWRWPNPNKSISMKHEACHVGQLKIQGK